MPDYVTASDLRSFKDKDGNPYNLSTYLDTDLNAYLNAAEELIEQITNNKFASYMEVWKIDGTGEPGLMFQPKITYPLISVTSVEELDEYGNVSDIFVEDEDFINRGHYLVAGSSGIDPYSPRTSVMRLGGYWLKGLKNYQVTGVWGMGETPEAVKLAIKLLALEMMNPGITGMTHSDVESFRLGDYSVTYRGDSAAIKRSSMMTGFPTIDRYLMPYVSYAGMVMNSTEHAYLVSSVLVS